LGTFKIVFGSGSNAIAIDNLLIDPLVVTGVEEKPGLPLTTKLEGNYPNPFNPTTVVSYQLSAVSNVRLSVYDLLGREVAVLVNEQKAPGNYEARFDAAGISSGVYFVKLAAGSYVETRKMMLMR
jgi:hypothetical protein